MSNELKPKDLPTTVKRLNSWLLQHFSVFEGPPRAFFELPFPVAIGFEGELARTETIHRVSYLSMSFSGAEEECCICLAAHLRILVTHEKFIDAVEPLFIRRHFELVQDDASVMAGVYGRLAFWRTDLNRRLIASRCYRPEGALPNAAKMPLGYFDVA